MQYDDPGKIRNRQFGTQIRDFSGLRFGSITPTDIDGEIEYHNRAHVLIETKYKDAKLPAGQRLALERMCDDFQVVKPAIAIISSHSSSGDIDMANTSVTEIRFNRKWHILKRPTTTKEMITRFFKWVDKKDFKP